MRIMPVETPLLSQKVIAHINPEMAKVYNVPEDHRSVGFFAADNDDVAYLAADDATKKANIKGLHAEAYYGGQTCSWSRYGGGVFVLFSGPKLQDVKSGIAYVNDYIKQKKVHFKIHFLIIIYQF